MEGRSPYAVNSKKFGMWLFIISDSLTFSAMLFAYTYSRVDQSGLAQAVSIFRPAIIFSTVMTFCLLSSSLTMVMAVHAMNHGNRKCHGEVDSGAPWPAAGRSWSCT